MINKLKSWFSWTRKKFSWKRFALTLGGFYLFYLLFAYLAVDPLVKKLLPGIAEKSLASKASVGHVAFDPFRLKATIDHFQLSTQSNKPLASFKKLVVDFELSGMFDRAWKFKEISLAGPEANIAIDGSGRLNWDAMMAKLGEDKSPPSNTITRLIIENIVVKQGKVAYVDHSRPTPINTTLTPLGFQLKGFSTLPRDRGDYLISAAFAEDGGSLKWKGDMGVNPVASKGVVALERIKIASMLELVEGLDLPIKLSSGDIDAGFHYDFSMPETIPTLALANVELGVNALAGAMADGSHLSLAHVSVTAPKLGFVKSKTPQLNIQDIGFELADFEFKQHDQMQLSLKTSEASLPKLDLSLTETPQLVFDDLNIKLANIGYQQGDQFSVNLPEAQVNMVGLNLAAQQININEVLLSNAGFIDSRAKQSDQPLASLKAVKLTKGLVELNTQKISAASVQLSGLDTAVIRNADNSINWVKVFDSGASAKAETAVDKVAKSESLTGEDQSEVPESKPWTMQLDQLALNDANIHVQDNTTAKPVMMDIINASIEAQGASLDMSQPLPLKATFSVKQGGKFSTKGKLWPSPLKADMTMRLSQLSLKPFASYVNQVALLKLSDGALDVSGKLNMQQKQDLALGFKGRFAVKRLALLEEANDAPFLSWEHLGANRLSFSLAPNKLHMATLKIVKPSGKFIIHEDRSLNVQRILRSEQVNNQPETTSETESQPELEGKPETVQAAVTDSQSMIQPKTAPVTTKEEVKAEAVTKTVAPPATSEPGDSQAFPVSIDRVVVGDGKLEFADLSLTPQFGTNIHSLSGVVNGLSTNASKVSQVEMGGKVDEYGSARIRGTLQPFKATEFTDIKLAFTNLDMSRLTPYSGKFAGRRIESGKLSVDLGYKIKQQQLVGDNKFVINKIKLGEKVESKDAADLPLDLAIAILEDGDGMIDLDLPISGSLDDPEFSYGSIVWKAIKNVLTKIVTAPFRALGKLFGGDGEDFDGISFEAGVNEISPPEMEKLVKVSDALNKRQGLSIGVVPSYHTALDTQAIKQVIYRQQVAEAMGLTLEAGQKPGPVDLQNEDTQDAIDDLYNKLTKKGFFKRMTSKLKQPEEGHYEKAQAALIESIEVTAEDLQQLAQARGKAIQQALLDHGIAADRVSMQEAVASKEKEVIKTQLTLDVKKEAVQSEVEEVKSDAPDDADVPADAPSAEPLATAS